MTTNVATVPTVPGYWRMPTIQADAFTAAISSPYWILWYPDTSKSVVFEEVMEETPEIKDVFAEFAREDIELAELGMAEYNASLMAEDMA